MSREPDWAAGAKAEFRRAHSSLLHDAIAENTFLRSRLAEAASARDAALAEVERLTKERDDYRWHRDRIVAELATALAKAHDLGGRLAKAREALGRISSNGFGHPLRNLDPKRDKEMLAMMDYARSTLAALGEKP